MAEKLIVIYILQKKLPISFLTYIVIKPDHNTKCERDRQVYEKSKRLINRSHRKLNHNRINTIIPQNQTKKPRPRPLYAISVQKSRRKI